MTRNGSLDLQTILDRILYLDDDLLILNKPNRLPLYRGPGGGVVLGDFLEGLRFGLSELPSPAHRLDSATSGCLVLGRHVASRRMLGDLFAQKLVEKIYWAIVDGRPPEPSGLIALPLRDVGWAGRPRVRVDEQGKMAETAFRTLGYWENQTLLELLPITGRTHQLRVHCAVMGCPIVGDYLYNAQFPSELPLHLHARRLTLFLMNPLTVEADCPDHMVVDQFAGFVTGINFCRQKNDERDGL
ncbi:MAG: RNA pseudouridine synthase [Magnetococcus sp. DMHC-6]